MLVLPADHRIDDVSAFYRGIEQGKPWRKRDISSRSGLCRMGLKPGMATFRKDLLWKTMCAGSSGLWKAGPGHGAIVSVFRRLLLEFRHVHVQGFRHLRELEAHAPDMVEICRNAVARGRQDLDFSGWIRRCLIRSRQTPLIMR